MIPKHFSNEDIDRLLANRHQQDRYLDYFQDRMDFWYSTLMAETDPLWIEVAYQNFVLVADRMHRLLGLLG